VDTTVAAVRRIAADLRPVMLDDLGLVAALENLLHDLSQRTGIIISLDAGAAGLDFHEPLPTAIYRIAQEALTNVARHAGATEVDVTIRVEGERLLLAVRDDGRGFDPEQVLAGKSHGILGIRERAHTLGGTARFVRPADGGMLVEIEIPVARYRGAGGGG
jgi:two-component system, NarL family, sensor histidine kinase UhpB